MKHKINAADAVTASRVVFAAFLLLYPAFSVQFYAFYILGAVTDMIDGPIARKLNLKSSFGAKLDMTADFIFIMAVLARVLPAIYVPKWLWIWIAVIALIKLANIASSLVMFHRIVSAHTVMNKAAGFMLFLLPFGIGRVSWQAMAVAVIISCSMATIAAIVEGHLMRSGKEIE